MKNIKWLISLSIVVIIMSCGTTKSTQQRHIGISQCERLATIDCPKEKIRGYGTASSKDKNFAREQAILRARNDLASIIQSRIRSYMEVYNADISSGDDSISERAAKNIITQTIVQNLTGSYVLLADAEEQNGVYSYEVCVELDEERVLKGIFSNSAREGVEINMEKFKASAEAAWEKMKVTH